MGVVVSGNLVSSEWRMDMKSTHGTTRFGFWFLASGLFVGFSIGLGGYIALDWANLSDESGGDFPLIGRSPTVLGVGLSFNIKLPGV